MRVVEGARWGTTSSRAAHLVLVGVVLVVGVVVRHPPVWGGAQAVVHSRIGGALVIRIQHAV